MSELAPNESTRVFLLIENRLLREALVRLFRKRSDLTVVGQSGQVDSTTQDILDSDCDVLVIASFNANWLPANFTLESMSQLGLKIVLIGMDANEDQFLAAVRSVVRGDAVCPPQLCHTLFRFVAQMAKEMPAQNGFKPDLTLRQQQLVALVAQGLTNKEI